MYKNEEKFEELLKNIELKNKEELKILKDKVKKDIYFKIAICFCLIFYLIFLNIIKISNFVFYVFSYLFCGICFVLIVKEIEKKTNYKIYKKRYEEVIIEQILKLIDLESIFNIDLAISHESYDCACFENYNFYYSTNLVKTNSNVLGVFANVLTQAKIKDRYGKVKRITIFDGVFEVIKLPKKVPASIFVRLSDKCCNFEKAKQIFLDSSEFNDKYLIFSTNKIIAFQIFTSDVMQNILQLQNDYDIQIEFTVKDDICYIRYLKKVEFKPNIFLSFKDQKQIYEIFKLYNLIFEFSNCLEKNIEEVEF